MKVTAETLTEDQLNGLTEAQMKELDEKGEIEIEDGTPPSGQQPPAGEEGAQTPPPGAPGEQAGQQNAQPPAPDDDPIVLKQKLADSQKENERLRRESDGRLRDLIESRKHKEQKPPDQPPVDPFAELMKDVGDDDFIDAKRFKAALKKMQDYIGAKEQDFNTAVEQRVSEMLTIQRMTVVEESRKRAEGAHTDYKDTVTKFFETLSPAENALVNQELAKSQDPAEEAYKMAKRFMALRQNEGITDAVKKKPAPRIPSGGSGGGAPGKITVEQFLAMTDEQIAKIPEAELRELHKQMGETQ